MNSKSFKVQHGGRIASLLMTCLLLPFSIASANQPTVDEQLASISKELIGQLQGRALRRMAVSEFVSLNGEHTSLTRYLTDKLTTQLVARSSALEIIDRSQISTVLSEQKLSESGLLDPTTVRKIGKLAGVDVVLVGVITVLQDFIDINMKALDVETARIHAAISARIEGSEIRELSGVSSGVLPKTQVAGVIDTPTSSVRTNPFYDNDFIRIELESIGVSDRLNSITITLSFKSKLTSDSLYIGAKCCYAEWLSMVDNNGSLWKSDQWKLTEFPNYQGPLAEISPGNKIYVSGQFTPYNDSNRGEGNLIPKTISITGAMIRRTQAQQESAARHRAEIESTFSSPFTFGISGIPVSRARGTIGLTFKAGTTTNDLARVNSTNGLVIASVEPGGPAQAAGVQSGDVLEKIDGTPVSSTASSQASMVGKKPGEYILLLINRSGVRFEKKVRLD